LLGGARAAVFAACALLLAACATAPVDVAPAAAAATPGAPRPMATVPFIDLDSFDKAMDKALSGGATQVQITMLTPMSPNAIPPRLGRWLNTVQQNGGQLSVDSDVPTRSLSVITALLALGVDAWQDHHIKSLVRGMDAQVTLRANEIQSITLHKKDAAAS
jgi:hypothetical protein